MWGWNVGFQGVRVWGVHPRHHAKIPCQRVPPDIDVPHYTPPKTSQWLNSHIILTFRRSPSIFHNFY
jgi:hypothetical protein